MIKYVFPPFSFRFGRNGIHETGKTYAVQTCSSLSINRHVWMDSRNLQSRHGKISFINIISLRDLILPSIIRGLIDISPRNFPQQIHYLYPRFELAKTRSTFCLTRSACFTTRSLPLLWSRLICKVA